MNDADLVKLIVDTGTFQAAYQPVPLSSKPSTGCDLPPELAGSVVLPAVDLPSVTKVCAPPFTEFPLILEPFVPPETCSNGITFTGSTVNIYPTYPPLTPAGTITVSARQSVEDMCNYEIAIPDVVIPCYPLGPKFSGSANITVTDRNAHTSVTSSIGITQDPTSVCNWTLRGDVNIEIPVVPCPDGFTVISTGVVIQSPTPYVNPDQDLPITVATIDGCNFAFNFPPLQIPCYPTGPRFTFRTTPDGGSTHTTLTPSTDSTGCAITVDIPVPCGPSGPTFSTSSVLGTYWTPASDLTGCAIDLPIPTPICTGGFKFVDAVSIHLNSATPLSTVGVRSEMVLVGSNVYTVSNIPVRMNAGGAATVSLALTSGSGTGVTFDGAYNGWVLVGSGGTITGSTSGSLSFTTGGAGAIGLELDTHLAGVGWQHTIWIPVTNLATATTSEATSVNLVGLQDYFAGLGLPGTTECGFAMVGDINLGLACPSGYSMGTNHTLTFGRPASGGDTVATTLAVSSCALAFDTVSIPALVCNAYTTPTVALSIQMVDPSTGVDVAQTEYTGPQTLAVTPVNDGPGYCGFAITGTLHVPAASTGAGIDSNANHYQGDFSTTHTYSGSSIGYNPNDVVRVSPTNAAATGGYTVPGVYICVGAVRGSSSIPTSQYPRNPAQTAGENSAYWHWMATWPKAMTVCEGSSGPVNIVTDQQPAL